ncbi:MAG: sigma-70 family RNA polymerase sigma factor [Flavobacteriales bacterium]|nr:sigma-70 family RNA polymerase sigma factor [Flavobacteriales bacterium]
MNDQKIIEILRSNKRGKALDKLYKYYPKVESFIRSNGGEKQDAQDLYQEALIIFCKKISKVEFSLTASINTYIYGICRFLWLKELKKRNKGQVSSIKTELISTDEEELQFSIEKEEKLKKAEAAISELGKRCKEILSLFYLKSLSMKVIA